MVSITVKNHKSRSNQMQKFSINNNVAELTSKEFAIQYYFAKWKKKRKKSIFMTILIQVFSIGKTFSLEIWFFFWLSFLWYLKSRKSFFLWKKSIQGKLWRFFSNFIELYQTRSIECDSNLGSWCCSKASSRNFLWKSPLQ